MSISYSKEESKFTICQQWFLASSWWVVDSGRSSFSMKSIISMAKTKIVTRGIVGVYIMQEMHDENAGNSC